MGELIEQSNDSFHHKIPKPTKPLQNTLMNLGARRKKSLLMAPGSPAFQHILNECLENGVLCQIKVNLRAKLETLLKITLKIRPLLATTATSATWETKQLVYATKPQPCYHQINNGKIVSVKILKKQPVRYYQLYFSVRFTIS